MSSLCIALVRNHLEYASEVWNSKSITLIKLIENVLRRATRMLMPELEYEERLQKFYLLPLLHRREIKDLTTYFKMRNGLYSSFIDFYVEFCSDTRLRSTVQGKLKIRKCRTALFRAKFFNRVVYLCNNLPGSGAKFKHHC